MGKRVVCNRYGDVCVGMGMSMEDIACLYSMHVQHDLYLLVEIGLWCGVRGYLVGMA